ncbi:MAG TPA: flagellar protein, partial [Gammaproteobacteria bacterium]|nr:flagellar protein [Gammaproteobacteria bacterium]
DLDVKGGGQSNTVLLIALIVMLLLVGGGGAAFFLLSGDDSSTEADAAASSEHEAEKVESKETHYLKLGKEFVVNLEDDSKVNFMQIDIQVMARKTEPLDLIEENMPVIRNKLMLILSSQKYEEVNTREGKEKLREEIKQAIQDVLHEESSKANIEAVYFTSLIMQ